MNQDFFSQWPDDFGKGSLPKPYTEKGKKALDWAKHNALPIIGIVAGLII